MNEIDEIITQMLGRSEDGRTDRALWKQYAERLASAIAAERKMWRGRIKDAMDIAAEYKGALDHILNETLFKQQSQGNGGGL